MAEHPLVGRRRLASIAWTSELPFDQVHGAGHR